MRLHYNPHLKGTAHILRTAENLAEVLLWKEIRAKKLGVQFLRQRTLGNYIVDFYCHHLNFAIEIDGISHDSKVEKDNERQNTLESMGVRFLRFQDRDVRYNLDSVLRDIKEKILLLEYSLEKTRDKSAPPSENPSSHQNEVLPLRKGE